MKVEPKQVHVSKQYAHGAPLINCRFDPKGRYVFATAEDRAIIRWNLVDGKKTEFKAHDSWVRGIAFSKDSETFVTAGYDDTLVWWSTSAEKPEPIRKVKAHDGWIRAVDVSPDGKLLASGGNDRILKLWNLADGKPVRQMTGHELDIYSVMFHPEGKHILSGDLMGHVRQWEIATGKEVRKFDAKDLHTYNSGQKVHYGGVRSLAMSPDNKHLVAGGLYKGSNPLGAVNEPLVMRYEWESQKVLKKHITDGVKGVIWRTLFHPEGFLIGASGGSGGGYLIFWETEKDKSFHKFKMPDTTREMDLHPDGITLATVHWNKKLLLNKLSPKPKTKKK